MTTRLEILYARLEKARQKSIRANRWGEARRFAGRMAGNRLAEIDHIQNMIDKEYQKQEKNKCKLQYPLIIQSKSFPKDAGYPEA